MESPPATFSSARHPTDALHFLYPFSLPCSSFSVAKKKTRLNTGGTEMEIFQVEQACFVSRPHVY